MKITMDDVLGYLDSDEPSYDAAAQDLGADAMPHLMQLAGNDDAGLAGKAAYLAALIGGPEAAEVLSTAARHEDASVRVAAASAVAFVPAETADVVLRELVRDEDTGVRRIAVESVLEHSAPEFLQTLRGVVSDEQDQYIRQLAGDAVERIESSAKLPL